MNKGLSGRKMERVVAAILIAAIALARVMPGFAYAAPTGASITNISHTTKTPAAPSNRVDSKGTINTVNLNSVQQNLKWKAYVGNVSSTFVLDDSNDYTIYQWTLSNFNGEVYVSRSNSVSWASIGVATIGNKQSEDTALTHVSSNPDSINQTFVNRIHKAFSVGTIPIAVNSTYAIVPNVNDTVQVQRQNSLFQEVLLHDGTNLVYASLVENDKSGYRTGNKYDFELLVAENATASSGSVTYYFFIELE
jgi:hypothetical protein